MKTLKVVILFLFLLNSCAPTLNKKLQEDIWRDDLNISVLVKDLGKNKTLYSHHPGRLFNPASTTKVFTAFSALSLLGEDYTYKTKLYKEGKNYYLKFVGDPTFKHADLIKLLANIEHLESNIIIDDTSYDQNYYSDGETFDDQIFCYAAPTSAIIIDKNCFKTKFQLKQESLKITSKYGSLELKTDIEPRKDNDCELKLKETGHNSYEITGCYNSDEPLPLQVAIKNPRLLAENAVKLALKQLKINYNKPILFVNTPSSAKFIAEHNSLSLKVIVKEMLTESDNLIAKSLSKKIGETYFNTQGSFALGQKAMQKILPELKGISLTEGSGASRYNFLSSEHLIKLLEAAANNNSFVYSLATPGENGTLKKRKFNSCSNYKIYAKTGTLRGVSSLTGYLIPINKQRPSHAFSILINGYTKPASQIKALEEEIVNSVCEGL
jgi:D-alanyl-D-alanine carboxypeptidase/D-alanyl-D-alanine-endopeptidase (penicillin-binding protein 4)